MENRKKTTIRKAHVRESADGKISQIPEHVMTYNASPALMRRLSTIQHYKEEKEEEDENKTPEEKMLDLARGVNDPIEELNNKLSEDKLMSEKGMIDYKISKIPEFEKEDDW